MTSLTKRQGISPASRGGILTGSGSATEAGAEVAHPVYPPARRARMGAAVTRMRQSRWARMCPAPADQNALLTRQQIPHRQPALVCGFTSTLHGSTRTFGCASKGVAQCAGLHLDGPLCDTLGPVSGGISSPWRRRAGGAGCRFANHHDAGGFTTPLG